MIDRDAAWFVGLAFVACVSCASPLESPDPAAPSSNPSAAAPTLAIEDGRLVLDEPIEFETGGAALLPASDAVLERVVAWMRARPEFTRVRIECHVDLGGDRGVALSGDRALSVARALVARGVACQRLIAAGFGDAKPVADRATPAGRAANRRVEIRPAELRGHAIGGLPLDGSALVTRDPCAP